MTKPTGFLFALTILALLLASCAKAPATPVAPATPTPAGPTFTNPLNNGGPDPWMTYYEGNYYLATTTGGATLATGLTMRKAPTIDLLKKAEPEKIWSDSDNMRCCQYWAPEFHLLDGPNGKHWYGLFTGGPSKCCSDQHLMVIESKGTDPMGPYTFKADLNDGYDRWFIDGSYLKLNNKLYLIYSAFTQGKEGQGPQSLYIMEMSDPWTLTGDRHLLANPTLKWETLTGTVNEGPVALYHGDKTYIVYSGNGCWGPNYALGMLTYQGGDPLQQASWKKSDQPVFKGTDKVWSPGHNTFMKSPDGSEDWIIYHANDTAQGVCDDKRSTRIQKFTWNADGTPNFGTPVPPGVPIPVPSGEKQP